ncbi:MAG: Threonine/Serine exporter, ThrE [Firmicutes bacterium]|nr:Threonine/Serine exporter, ThrE [Bacillota bacterium]
MVLAAKIVAAFLLSGAIGILYRVPRSVVFYSSLNGTISWLILYSLIENGVNVITASFCGSLAVGIIAETLARLLRKPSTVFIIPGFIPLVPGREAYTTMRYMVEGWQLEALSMGVQTLLMAGAIAFGIIISISGYRLAASFKFRNETGNVDEN